MAKSPSEQFKEIAATLATLTERVDNLRETEVALLTKQLDEMRASVRDQTEALTLLREKAAGLEQIIAELKRNVEESDKRRWQFTMLFFGSVLTLIVNLLLFAFRGK